MTKYILLGSAIALAISWGITYFMWSQNASLTEELAHASRAVAERDAAIETLQAQRDEDQRRIGTLGEKVNTAQTEKDKAVGELNSYRERLSRAAMARPTLVGRIATRATARVMQQFNSASGGTSGGEDVSPTASGPD